MTQTLTTERVELWRRNAEICGSTTDPVVEALQARIIALADELLANREAQPVRYLNKFSGVCVTLEQQPNAADDFAVYAPLYATPPAPAVPPEKQHPDVDEYGGDRYYDPYITECDQVDGWNACRAAMLAQPVSQGYKLNSPEIPDGCQWTFDEHDSKWDSGCGEAWMFCDGGPTENGVKFCQNCGNPVLLAAAPEGSNG